MKSEEKFDYKLIFRQKQYMKTVIAAAINRFGDSIDSIAFTWLIYQITQSASWSAIIFGVNRIPTIFLQPFAGAAIEGKNKKRIMILTDIIRGICVGFIATAFALGFLNQWMLLGATIIISSAEAFRGPASSALIPKLLDKEAYSYGLSLNASACSIMELIGLGAAGVIISYFSVSAAIYIDMVTFFLSALIILTLRIKEDGLISSHIPVKEYMDSLKDGFSYIKKDRMLRYFTVLVIFLNAVLVPFNSLQAPLISEVLKVDEIMLSVLGTALSLGMVIGAAIYPYMSSRLSNRTIASFGSYSIAGFYLMFVVVGGLVDSARLIYCIVSFTSFLVGCAIALLSSFFNVEFMKNIQADYIARVSAIFSACGTAAIPVTAFFVSILAEFTSSIVLFLIAGILTILICLVLCNKKRFQVLNQGATEVNENEEKAADSAAC
jgi:MFS family permease